MQSPLSRYAMLARRWAWVIILGIVICSGTTYAVSKLMRPIYQASAFLVVTFQTSQSAYDNTTASLEVLPTYAQLITSPAVLKPVLALHRGMTMQQLNGMITVKPQSNTQLIEIDVENGDPRLSMKIANEVAQSFAQFSNTQLPAIVQILPAELPIDPVRPKPSTNALIGALVGLGLAIALIVIFEWIDDRPASVEQVQELMGLEVLTVIPQLSRRQREKSAEEIPTLAEGCRTLCVTLNVAQLIKPFKLVMITSALAAEGKSTISANLASYLATSGKRVLLVDTNLRNPALDQHFQLDNRHGIANAFLKTWAQLEGNLNGQATEMPTLRILTAGTPSGNAADLLQSPLGHQIFDHFKKLDFDYVIFDTPPLLPVADAQILASYVQAAVLVVDASKTSRKMLLRAKRVLSRTGTTILGVAINKSPWSEYGVIRQYLSNTPQPKIDLSVSMPSSPPQTPPVSELGSEEITITLSRLQKNGKGEE
jgi:capsular exopolysaccharide synthesis family protein